MCRFKSGIILKERLFIRAELVPKDGNVFSDINNWVFIVDQDILPDWYVKDYDKQRMVEAVKEWAKNHIHIGVDNLEITSGNGHYIKDCKDVVIYGSAKIERICGNAIVRNIYGNATVKRICGSATVKWIYGSAKVESISGSATVKYICDSAKVERICGNATVKCISGSAIVKDIFGNATVEGICDNATVECISDNATVERIYCNATIYKAKGQSTIITSPYFEFENKDKLILLENATFFYE